MTDLTNLANDIQAVKSDLANAISLKGVPCSTNDAFNSYSDKVNSIQSGYFPGVNFANITTFPQSGYMTFQNMSTLKGDLMFNSLTTISSTTPTAFYDCNGITGAYFPNLTSVNHFILFDNCPNIQYINCPSLISISGYGLAAKFRNCINLSSVDFSSLSSCYNFQSTFANTGLVYANFPLISNVQYMNYMFYNCQNLESIDFSNLTNISFSAQYMCANCFNLQSVDFSNLSWAASSCFINAFRNCHNLGNFSLPNYSYNFGSSMFYQAFSGCYNMKSFSANCQSVGQTCFYAAFARCNNLTNFSLNSISTELSSSSFAYAFQDSANFNDTSFLAQFTSSYADSFAGCFMNCYALNGQNIYFNSLDYVGGDSFGNMLYGVSDCTVHFKSSLQSSISSLSSVLAGFGGTNTTVLFDL